MIVYGWNTKNIKQAPLDNYECPHCKLKESSILILAKYVHIFWIPVFPYQKSAVVFCSQCKHEADEKACLLDTGKVKQLKAAVPLPKYLFSGLALILLAIAYFTYAGVQDDEREQSYLENPRAGDVYLMKSFNDSSSYNHYLLKVRDVAGDSLWVSGSTYNYNGIVSQLDPEDGFYDIMYPIHKDVIHEFQASGALQKIMRDYSPSAGFDRDIEYQEADTLQSID